jgi:hypothetical protein
MSDRDVVETVFGKHNKYEVVRSTHLLSSPTYYVWRDGKPYRGTFKSLRDAVEAAQSEG